MNSHLHKLHPYRLARVAAQYDRRTKTVADEARSIRTRYSGPKVETELSNIQEREYGSMDDDEFRHRVSLAKAMAITIHRWHSGGQQVLVVGEGGRGLDNIDADFALGLHRHQIVFFQMPPENQPPSRFAVEGFYIERAGEASDETCIIAMACSTPISPESPTLAHLLTQQSQVIYALAPSLASGVQLHVIRGDASVLAHVDPQVAFDHVMEALSGRANTPTYQLPVFPHC